MASVVSIPEADKSLQASINEYLNTLKATSSTNYSEDDKNLEFGSKRFDELGNFKSGRPVQCVGKCFLQIGDVTPHNIKQLKAVVTNVLPVVYNERFYTEVVGSGDLSKLAYFNDSVVGAICTRLENKDGHKRLYIMMIGTLTPYRKFGIGTMLMSHVFALCEKDPQIESVYLHVQVFFVFIYVTITILYFLV